MATTELGNDGSLASREHQLSQAAVSLARARSSRIDVKFGLYATLFVLAGYLLADRAFAWIHIPGTPLFIGEIAMVVSLFVAFSNHQVLRVFTLSRPMQALAAFIGWGLILMLFGLPGSEIDAIRDAALFYYGFFAVAAAVLLFNRPEFEEKLIVLYTRLIVIFFTWGWIRLFFQGGELDKIRNGFPMIPDSLVPITSHKTGNIAVQASMALMFIALFIWPKLKEGSEKMIWGGISISGILLLIAAGTQTRGGLLAGIIALLFMWALNRATRKTMVWAFTITFILALLAVSFDVKFDLARREVSVQQFAGNIFSILAGGEEGNVGGSLAPTSGENANTANWRLELWGDVWGDVVGFERGISGFGFGESLAERYDKNDRRFDESIQLRNPHNSHLSVLARMGVTGAALWVLLFWTWFRTLNRARRNLMLAERDEKAKLILWCQLSVVAILINAFFDPTLEGPQQAVWLWFIFGIGSVFAFDGHRERWRRTLERHTHRVDLVTR